MRCILILLLLIPSVAHASGRSFGGFTASDTITSGMNGTDGTIKIYSEQGTTDYNVIINPHTSMTVSTTYQYPPDLGAAGEAWKVNGSGVTEWVGLEDIVGDLVHDRLTDPEANTTVTLGDNNVQYLSNIGSTDVGTYNIWQLDVNITSDSDNDEVIKAINIPISNASADSDTVIGMAMDFEDSVVDGDLTSFIQLTNSSAGASADVTDGILMTSNLSGGIIDAIDVSDQEIDNAINIGANAIAGTNFNVTWDGTVSSTGGRIVSVDRIVTPTTLTATHHHVFIDTDDTGLIVTLPAGVAGTEYRVVNTGTSSNNATITPNGAELLVGVNSNFTLYDGEALNVIFQSESGWY